MESDMITDGGFVRDHRSEDEVRRNKICSVNDSMKQVDYMCIVSSHQMSMDKIINRYETQWK
jgi:hypothetical protein